MLENLNEMIQADYEEVPESIIDQNIESVSTDQKSGILRIETPSVKEASSNEEPKNENTDIVPYGNQFTFLEDDFQPKTEDELITLTGRLHKAATSTIVITYFHIGNAINAYYHKQYGSGELQRIADQTGVSLDTLHKSCKFADRYSKEQLEALLNGLFPISWNHIANNLSVEADELVETYKDSDSPKTFHKAIINFKKVRPRRAVPIIDANDEMPGTDESVLEESKADIEDGIMRVPSTPETYENRGEPETADDVKVEDAEENKFVGASDEIMELNDMLEDSKAELLKRDKQMKERENVFNEMNSEISLLNDRLEDCKSQLSDKDNPDDIVLLNEMLENCKMEILKRDKQKEEDDRIFKEMDKELAEKDKIVERFKKGFKQLVIMVENGAGHADLLDMISGIEFDTI